MKTVGADELKRFYRDWYRPELMAVVVVGDISVAEIEAEITRRFSGLENPPDSPRRGATAFRRTPIFDSKR
ncbi:MAG: insulinase family protein [Proteobacteria bacterium]|nr:insulinase family protein [Pseudomonadota bacterium]